MDPVEFYVTDGANGTSGAKGEPGVGIANIQHDRNDEHGNCIYVITLTDGRTEEFTAYKGAAGADGKDGLTTSVKINGVTYVHNNGTIELPEFLTAANLLGYATENYVLAEIAKAKLEGEDIDLSGLATKDELNTKADKEHTHSQYLTEHQSLANYYTKEEAQTKFLSKDEAGTATTPFIEDKYVTNPIGDFKVGESVKGLSVAEIFAKLLGLTDTPIETPEEPDVPPGSTGIVNTIINEELSMYVVTDENGVEAIPYQVITMSEAEAAEMPTEAGFYQIKDASGNVIESGYQELQINNDEVYYVIALPKEIDYDSMVTVKAWNDLESCWTDTVSDKPALTCDVTEVSTLCDEAGIDISHINTDIYTVWAMEAMPDGSVYRFVINE
jgi:hypothetical protein